MPAFDDLTKGLKSPMWSTSTPATTQVRDESGKSTDQLLAVPEDGDTKSADPESWMKEDDYGSKPKINKKMLMRLPGLKMTIFTVAMPDNKSVVNFVDDDAVPVGEIWVNERLSDSPAIKPELIKSIIICYLVDQGGNALDNAHNIADTVGRLMKMKLTENR
jgi:hypothetical protein